MKKKFLVTFVCAMLSFSFLCNPVSAFLLGSYHVPAKQASYAWGNSITSVYQTAWQNAANDWYNADSVAFYYSSSSCNTVDAYVIVGDTAYGKIYYESHLGSTLKQFSIVLNTAQCTSDTIARSTSAHEIGHALGLGDLESGRAVMNVNRNRSRIYTPMDDDISGVRYIYGY